MMTTRRRHIERRAWHSLRRTVRHSLLKVRKGDERALLNVNAKPKNVDWEVL